MATVLHKQLMELCVELMHRGESDMVRCIQKGIANEQKKKRKRRGEPKVEVKIGPRGHKAWIPKRLLARAKEEAECE